VNSRAAPSSGYPHRAITPEEVVDVARRLRQRLGRHLDALEAGECGAVDDVAAVLRILLVHGSGNNVIVRLCRTNSIPLPRIQVSEPVADHQSIGLAFGAVPALSGDEPVRVVDIDTWRGWKALIVRGAPRRASTWEQLIKEYANTFGSHLSGTIPHLLSQMASICYSGPLDLGEYLIHCAGLVAEDALHQVLGTIDGDDAPRHRRLNPLVRLIVESRLPHPPQMTTGFTLEDRPLGKAVPIVKVLLDGTYMMLELTPRGPNEVEYDYEITNEKPEWWSPAT
jgi:hypothetical protein